MPVLQGRHPLGVLHGTPCRTPAPFTALPKRVSNNNSLQRMPACQVSQQQARACDTVPQSVPGFLASGRATVQAERPSEALTTAPALTSAVALEQLQTVVAAIALSLITLVPGFWYAEPAQAFNVRLRDVESPAMQQGVRAATSGDFVTAERIFLSMLQGQEFSNSASVFSNLGNVHMSMGRPEQAVIDYSKAIELAPGAPVPYLNRAIAYEELGVQLHDKGQEAEATAKWDEAIHDCDLAIERDPKEFAAWFNKGNAELRLQAYTTALTSFNTAADLAPGIAGYRLRAAQLMFQCGDNATAARTVRGITRKYPNYAEAHLTLAGILWSTGQLAAAEDSFNTALNLEARWNDMEYVQRSTRWPPVLVAAVQKLLVIDG